MSSEIWRRKSLTNEKGPYIRKAKVLIDMHIRAALSRPSVFIDIHSNTDSADGKFSNGETVRMRIKWTGLHLDWFRSPVTKYLFL